LEEVDDDAIANLHADYTRKLGDKVIRKKGEGGEEKGRRNG
jgi:hypothetical protein